LAAELVGLGAEGAGLAAGVAGFAAEDAGFAAEDAGLAADPAGFEALDAGVLGAAGFFAAGTFEGVLAAGFAGVDPAGFGVDFAAEAGAFAAGAFFGVSLSTILICWIPSMVFDQLDFFNRLKSLLTGGRGLVKSR